MKNFNEPSEETKNNWEMIPIIGFGECFITIQKTKDLTFQKK